MSTFTHRLRGNSKKMEAGVAANRTEVMTGIHPCYVIENFRYIMRSEPSTGCMLSYAFLTFLSVVTTCGNLLVIVSIMYFKQLHTPTNSLILSLAVADLLVGVIVFPFSMAFSLSLCMHHEGLSCKVRGSFDISLSTCSILNLCCISVDRYHAVCRPLTYRSQINRRVAVVMILGSWGVSGLIGVGVIIAGWMKCEERCLIDLLMENTIGPILSFYLPVVIMLCIYMKIFLVALKQARIIQNTASGVTASKSERKATKTLAVVLGVFLLCWTPFFLCITFLPLTDGSVPVSLVEALNWLTLSNSMLNPFIYAFFYSWFRSALRMIVSGKVFQGSFANSKLQ